MMQSTEYRYLLGAHFSADGWIRRLTQDVVVSVYLNITQRSLHGSTQRRANIDNIAWAAPAAG